MGGNQAEIRIYLKIFGMGKRDEMGRLKNVYYGFSKQGFSVIMT